MSQSQIDALNATIDKWSQLTFGMGALLVVCILAIVLALVIRGVFKREERQDITEDKSLDLAQQAFKALLERLPTWVEQISVLMTSLATATEAQNASLAGLRATANHHTSALQTTQSGLANLSAVATQQSTTLESIRKLLEDNGATMRLLATNVENIPAKTIAELTPKLEELRGATAQAVGEVIEAKRATDELPVVPPASLQVEGKIELTAAAPGLPEVPTILPFTDTLPKQEDNPS